MTGSQSLIDNYGRRHNYLRFSLTDRCNLRCSYCMPSHPVFMPNKKLMTAKEISILTSVFVSLGINKIRLTGGEPLLRKDFDSIVEMISYNNVSLHLTTNAYFLDKHINTLHKHFSSINISLDSLRKERFIEITQRNALEKTLRNIDLCLKEELKIKLNVVVRRNVNHDEIADFVLLTRDYPVEVRFIEFMPFQGNQWKLEDTYPHEEIIKTLQRLYPIESIQKDPDQTAEKYKVKDWQGHIGIISTVSKPFCENCNRIRVTSEGKLKTCLFGLKEYDLKPYLNDAVSLKQFISQSLHEKHYSYGGHTPLAEDNVPLSYYKNRSMTAIGG